MGKEIVDLNMLDKSELIRRLKESRKALTHDEEEAQRTIHDLQVHQIELELQNRELREMQNELETARNLYADLYDFAPVGYLTLDQHGLICEANLTASVLLGLERRDLIGHPLGSFIAKESRADFFRHLKEVGVQDDRNVSGEFVFRLRDGELRYIRLESRALGSTGQGCNLRTVLVDVTEKKEHEERERLLIQRARLSEMSEMVGAAIAHQWRQPLNALAIMVQDLLVTYGSNEFDRTYLEKRVRQSMEQIEYMSETIHEFQQFFKPSIEDAAFDVRHAIESALNLVSGQFANYGIRLAVHGAGFIVKGPEAELKNVIVNILHNSREAIGTCKQKKPELSGEVSILLDAGKRTVEIRDNGGGVDEHVMDQIFKPYVTTKGSAKGTGIGLYIAQTIIEQKMKGHISARNENAGAVIVLQF